MVTTGEVWPFYLLTVGGDNKIIFRQGTVVTVAVGVNVDGGRSWRLSRVIITGELTTPKQPSHIDRSREAQAKRVHLDSRIDYFRAQG